MEVLDLAERIEAITRAFVAVRSVNGEPGAEKNAADFLERTLRAIPYFAEHPACVIRQELAGDALQRANIFAYLTGTKHPSDRTILWHGHIDTVGTADYGALEPLALDPDALLQAMLAMELPEDMRAELSSGDWLPGRGACDMKSGGAVFIALLEYLSTRRETFAGTILLSLNPVEENEHLGMLEGLRILANTELLGFPIVQTLFGDDAIFYTAIVHIPFDLLVYSYGMRLMSGSEEPLDWHCLWNPGFLLTVFALLLYFSGLRLPAPVSDACYLVGNITTPVSMLVLGANLAEIALRDIFTEKRLYAMAAVRLAAIPALIYALLTPTGLFPPVLTGIATVTFGMPVGSMLVMFANEYDYCVTLSTKAVSLTTIGSLLTIPVMAWLFG